MIEAPIEAWMREFISLFHAAATKACYLGSAFACKQEISWSNIEYSISLW